MRRAPSTTALALCARRSYPRYASSRVTRSTRSTSGKLNAPTANGTGQQPIPNDARSAEDKAARIAKLRAVPLTLAAITAFGIGLYGVQLWVSTTRAADTSVAGPRTQEELTSVYDQTAATFDAEVDVSEWLMGIKGQRRRLAEGCAGHVLEVSCGTARNLGYYRFGDSDGGVKSLTLADLSVEMVQQGKQKWFALKSKGELAGSHKGVPVRFWHGDVKDTMPPPPKDEGTGKIPEGYDTIVQSMGLCSTDEPVELLKNLAQHLNPKNPESRIVLLEHGRSYYQWWNGVLDSQAATHASKHGCWWNRDIGDIVRRSGLEVVHERRRNFGTTWIFELKPVVRQTADHDGKSSGEHGTAGNGWSEWLPRWTYEKICKR
ncbi:S-adenosyl-L-methionine-dependent methyltransferase [Myriangium duriaei CBS 260.36]|uniref:S-adenosyl-L-methionine-dependent methyltransferase n=1 Tax=Myriangium duriaei CBS 260.36 TaxID=1168546 RepID=A0A9P4MGT2_9PEZI|nr:S-adenosyl-L-methionine-dependent methyltransferase [Myriangium duriaei CBS 260.36]